MVAFLRLGLNQPEKLCSASSDEFNKLLCLAKQVHGQAFVARRLLLVLVLQTALYLG